jgi:ferredoxin-thioredoxin reductase catalytic subunit
MRANQFFKQTQKQSKTKKVMKKQTSKISLKTDKIVSLSKEQVQSVVGGRYSDTVTTGKSRCWCRD